MLLGDAGLDGGKGTNIYFGHSIKQLTYALFKKKLLDELTGKDSRVKFLAVDGKYPSVRVYPKICLETKEAVAICYADRKKVVTRNALDHLTLQGLAIWFMDDGCCSIGWHNGTNGKVRNGLKTTLNTYLGRENNQQVIDYFRDVWGLVWYNNLSKGKYRLGMGTHESRRLFSLLRPFIIPEMQYKLKRSASELHGTSYVLEGVG